MRRSLHMRVGACVRVFPLGFVSSLTVSFWGVLRGAFQSPTPCEAYDSEPTRKSAESYETQWGGVAA